jgi:sucrose-6-phosphate hydrolase SacC (GH32 family)
LPGSVRSFVVLLALASVASFAPPAARAQEGPYSSALYIPPSGYRAKEFTLVRKDGWFHLFYLRENLIPNAPTQRSFGHAISRDLYSWAEQDTVLPVVDDSFEESHVWAPSLHLVDGTYYMFYPGVRHDPANGYIEAQSITVATSTDLYTWTRRETPLFDNRLFPWAYADTTNGLGRDCRDPFLWWDAASGEWLLYVATRPGFQPLSMVIAIAGSTDLEHWEDRGYVPMTLPSSSFSDVAESPHLFTRDGSTLYLLWTTNAGQQLTYGTSTSALTGWGNSRRLRSMLGYSTLGWWASELVEADGRTYFGNVHNTLIDFWDFHWTTLDSFRLSVPDPLQVLEAHFDRDSAAPGDTLAISVSTVNGTGRELALEYTAPDSGGAILDPLPLGLPATVVLTGDSSVVTAQVALPPDVPALRVAMRAPGSMPGPASVLSVVVPVPPPPDPDPPSPSDDATTDPVPPLTRALIRFAGAGEVRFVRASAPNGFCASVYDVRGRKVWSECGGPGTRSLVWRPDASVAGAGGPGIYFARIAVPGSTTVETIKVPWVRAR